MVRNIVTCRAQNYYLDDQIKEGETGMGEMINVHCRFVGKLMERRLEVINVCRKVILKWIINRAGLFFV